MKINKKLLPIKGHYFLFNAGTAPLVPYLSTYARQLGFSAETVGLIYTVLPVCGLVAKPLFGVLADRFKIQKSLFILFQVVTIVSFGAIYFIPGDAPAVALGCEDGAAALSVCRAHPSDAPLPPHANCTVTCDMSPAAWGSLCGRWRAPDPPPPPHNTTAPPAPPAPPARLSPCQRIVTVSSGVGGGGGGGQQAGAHRHAPARRRPLRAPHAAALARRRRRCGVRAVRAGTGAGRLRAAGRRLRPRLPRARHAPGARGGGRRGGGGVLGVHAAVRAVLRAHDRELDRAGGGGDVRRRHLLRAAGRARGAVRPPASVGLAGLGRAVAADRRARGRAQPRRRQGLHRGVRADGGVPARRRAGVVRAAAAAARRARARRAPPGRRGRAAAGRAARAVRGVVRGGGALHRPAVELPVLAPGGRGRRPGVREDAAGARERRADLRRRDPRHVPVGRAAAARGPLGRHERRAARVRRALPAVLGAARRVVGAAGGAAAGRDAGRVLPGAGGLRGARRARRDRDHGAGAGGRGVRGRGCGAGQLRGRAAVRGARRRRHVPLVRLRRASGGRAARGGGSPAARRAAAAAAQGRRRRRRRRHRRHRTGVA